MVIAHRVRSPLVCVVAIGALYYALHLVTAQHDHSGTMAYGMPRIAAGFTAGVLLHRLYALKGAVQSTLVTTICVVAFAGSSAYDRVYNTEASIDYLPFLSCALIYCLLSPGRLTSALATPMMVYLGRISFALYMVHGVIIRLARSLVPVNCTTRSQAGCCFWRLLPHRLPPPLCCIDTSRSPRDGA